MPRGKDQHKTVNEMSLHDRQNRFSLSRESCWQTSSNTLRWLPFTAPEAPSHPAPDVSVGTRATRPGDPGLPRLPPVEQVSLPAHHAGSREGRGEDRAAGRAARAGGVRWAGATPGPGQMPEAGALARGRHRCPRRAAAAPQARPRRSREGVPVGPAGRGREASP